MSKKIVQYLENKYTYIVVGQSAEVMVIDHYDLGPGSYPVTTSEVLSIGQDGTFETLNTIYSPRKQLNG